MSLTPEQRALRARLAAHESWAATPDRSARTRAARDAFMARFEREVDPDGTMPPEQRRQAAESRRKAYYARLAFKSAQARAKRKGGGRAA